jgi:hypothetical protein
MTQFQVLLSGCRMKWDTGTNYDYGLYNWEQKMLHFSSFHPIFMFAFLVLLVILQYIVLEFCFLSGKIGGKGSRDY